MPAIWISCAAALLGHNPDTSYARVTIRPEHVETQLTYDVFTLLQIVPLDENRDGQVTREELARRAPDIAGFLRRQITLEAGSGAAELGEFSGYVWPPDTGDTIPEKDYHAATGLIHFRFERPVAELPEDVYLAFDFFEEFGERHLVLGAFVTEADEFEVTFSPYEPDFLFDTGLKIPLASRLWRFFKLGVEHIFLGYDHICFLIALIVVSKWRELVLIVTSFTIAHSLTLILATLQLVSLPMRLVEAGIAATIVYVAVENLWVKETRHRGWLTFCFGLVHGFGFAGVLREMGLPTQGLVRCLLSFNLGVEFGQLMIALLLLPVAVGLARWKHGDRAVAVISICLAGLGVVWFMDRALAWDAVPF